MTTSGVGGDEDVLPKFLPFERKYVSVGAVWRHNAPQKATRATVFDSRPHTMRDAVIPLVVPLKVATEPLQTRLGLSPQLNWRLPTKPRSFTTMEYGSEVPRTKCLELYTTMIELQAPQPSRAPRHPRGTSSRVPKHPRVISFSNFTATYHRGELKPYAPNAKARAHGVPKSFSLKSHQSNKCYGGK